MYDRTVLDNGTRVVTSPMPHTHSASVVIYFAVGSRYETDEIGGMSHFIEHMLFKGTRKRPTARDISEAIEGVGGIINAGTGKEYTLYWIKVASRHLPLAMDVLSDMVLNSTLEPEEVERERRVIIEEINMNLDSPSDLVNDLIDEVIWGRQAIGRNVAGTRESVSQITREDLLSYMNRYYTSKDAVISVAGNIDRDEILAQIYSMFGAIPAAASPVAPKAASRQRKPRARVHFRETEQANLCLGVPALPYTDPDRFTLNLLDTILGEGMSSRLFLQVRERQGLAYSVHSYTSQYHDVGSTIVYAGVDPARIDKSIKAILNELRKMREDPVPPQELTKAKEYSKGRMLLSLEDTRGVATWGGGQELLLGRILTPEEVTEIIDSVTADDILRVAQRIFVEDKLSLAVVGPYREEERFFNLLNLNGLE
ncbi:MAG: insulinase family protein [Chloroflexi bacterium]|nr:insulinase family protein [Chloroflexota bacterium]